MIGGKAKMVCRIKTKEDLELELATMKLMLYSMYDTFEDLLSKILLETQNLTTLDGNGKKIVEKKQEKY